MSKINLSIAEIGMEQDMRELYVYEAKLTGCEQW
jgi:CopG family transcriptional regulator/antitoxin EndoAI